MTPRAQRFLFFYLKSLAFLALLAPWRLFRSLLRLRFAREAGIVEVEDLVLGVVGGANEGAGLDVAEAEGFALFFEPGEGIGVDPSVDGQVSA